MSTRRALVVLGLLEVFGPISMDLYMPALPELARDLGTSDSLAQTTMSACMLGLALGQLVAGPLSDRLGRRRPLMVGIALFTVLSLACAAAPSIEVLVAARFLQGVTGSAGIVITLAVARDLASGAELARLLSLLTLVSAVAPILAPVAGGQLAAVTSWRGIFVVLAGIGLALLLVAGTLLRETLPPDQRHAGGRAELRAAFGAVLRDRLFLVLLAVASLGGVAFFSYLASISFVLQEQFATSPQLFSLFFAANSVLWVLGSQLNRAVVRRAGPARMYVVGTTAAAVSSLALLGAVLADLGMAAFLAALGLYLFTSGISNPNSSTLALSDHGAHAGTAAALFGTATFAVGPLVAPLVSLGGATALSMGLTLAVATTTGAVLVWVLARPRLARRAAAVPPGAAPDTGLDVGLGIVPEAAPQR
ncbi:multidrug effflux MFS transporter [Blastococcus sp. SYSU D00820]